MCKFPQANSQDWLPSGEATFSWSFLSTLLSPVTQESPVPTPVGTPGFSPLFRWFPMSQRFLVACMQARWSCCRVWSPYVHGGKGDCLGLGTAQVSGHQPGVPLYLQILCGSLTGRTSQKPHHTPTRFQVDFQCGCCLHPRPDIAFHFNPRFYTVKPHVICNTLQGGLWQKEVRWPGVALQRGASFLILFLFENEEVKVSRKGRHQAV